MERFLDASWQQSNVPRLRGERRSSAFPWRGGISP